MMQIKEIKITSQIYDKIKNTIGKLEPEQGGVLGGTRNMITNFFHDVQLVSNLNMYKPNIESINHELVKWQKNNVDFIGVIHSHPNGNLMLSYADKIYAQNLMRNNNIDQMIMFIVQSTHDSIRFLIKAFITSEENNTVSFEEINIKKIKEGG